MESYLSGGKIKLKFDNTVGRHYFLGYRSINQYGTKHFTTDDYIKKEDYEFHVNSEHEHIETDAENKKYFVNEYDINIGFIAGMQKYSQDEVELKFKRPLNRCDEMFRNIKSTSMDLRNFNGSEVEKCTKMFVGCENLVSLNFHGDFLCAHFNPFKCKTFSAMFLNCGKLLHLDISNFTAYECEDFSYMFANCNALESVNLFNVGKFRGKKFTSMFENCSSLTDVQITKFQLKNAEDMENMFKNCSSLVSLDMSLLDLSKCLNFNGLISGCGKLQEFVFPLTRTNKGGSHNDIANGTAAFIKEYIEQFFSS